MAFDYFLSGEKIMPVSEARIPLSNIEYAYGFGVYETIRVSGGTVFFLDDHIERLFRSAEAIGLEHGFTPPAVRKGITELVARTEAPVYNLKALLVGAPEKSRASLFAICSNPLFPDKKLYRDGADFITVRYERPFPNAKTLNMLQSYLAYRKASEAGAYDALLIDRGGNVTEGTRANFFCLKDKTIYTPPEEDILPGVTRKALLKVARMNGYAVVSKKLKLEDIAGYDGAFITSTSSKIVPVRSIDGVGLSPLPDSLKELMALFDEFLGKCNGVM